MENKKNKGIKAKIASLLLTTSLCFASGYAGVKYATSHTSKTATTSTNTITLTKYDEATSSSSTTLSGTEVASIISPTVVSIETESVTRGIAWYGSYVSEGAGSGVILTSDGYILTCAHVVDGASSIKVTTSDGNTYEATLVGSDTADDIAVIKINATNMSTAIIGDSSSALVGETVYADGNPSGALSGTITSGIISALSREISVQADDGSTLNLTVMQTSAAVSPGNSGGGLFNSKGELIGIVNAKSSGESEEGLGFAIPINNAMTIANDIITNGAYAVTNSTTQVQPDTTTSSTPSRRNM